MSVKQFANSLRIIQRSEHSNRAVALGRHLYWQARKLGFPRPIRLTLSRSTIMDDEPGGVIGLVNMLGMYDFNNMHFVQMVLRKAPVFVDVGANIGAYTLIASEIEAAQVLSLEPIPAAFHKLQRNIDLNGRCNVTALNVGASNRPGMLRMTCAGASPVNRILADDEVADETTQVQVESLDTICARLGIVPAVLKIDVEGHEPEVLAGSVDVLESCLACVVERGDRESVVGFMRRHGMAGPFYYHHRARMLLRTPQTLAEDQVFIGAAFMKDFSDIGIDG